MLIIPLLCSFSADAIADDSSPPAPTTASEASPDPRARLRFLYDAADWSGLRTEALLTQLEHPEMADEAALWAAQALIGQGELPEAHQELAAIVQRWPGTPTASLAALQDAALWGSTAPPMGLRMLEVWMLEHPEDPLRSTAMVEVAWLQASMGQPGKALSTLDAAGVPVSEELRADLLDTPRWKRPMLAAFLSGGLPGAGQLYAGYPQEAASAFLVNGLFIGTTLWSAQRESWPAVLVLGTFGLGFWSGNVYGAADAAVRHNRELRDQSLQGLAPLRTPLLPQAPLKTTLDHQPGALPEEGGGH